VGVALPVLHARFTGVNKLSNLHISGGMSQQVFHSGSLSADSSRIDKE